MAVHFHPLRVKKIQRETNDSVSITFDIPDTLQNTFLYREGQNVTVKTHIDGTEIRRSYSICAAPHENELRIAVKKIDGGLFSVYANDNLKNGDQLDVLPPTGKFYSRDSGTTHANYLAIAAGSGITPVISIIKHTLHTQPTSNFTLIYGNRSRSSIIFFEVLEGIKNKYLDRFTLIHVLSRELTDAPVNYGRIDAEKLQSLESVVRFQNFEDVYLCGPEQMIFSSADFLEKKGLDKSKIHFELFTTPGQKTVAVSDVAAEINTSIESRITIRLDGRSMEFPLQYSGDSVLDAALKKGADLPYACKGGVCCSCRAKLVEGKVEMTVNYALEEEEVAEGFILTCQSHPRSEKVVIDFDVR